jgi:hypothetical protein
MGKRATGSRAAQVRASWWRTIRTLSPVEAKGALLQALVDIDEHWDKEHPEDGLPEDLGISPDEYLIKLVERIRHAPPPEVNEPSD